MPKKSEASIKLLFAAIEDGTVKPDSETGYREVCEKVPAIALACKDTQWRDNFVTWWCRYKNKHNANRAIQPLPPVEEQEPSPPVPESEVKIPPEAPIKDADRPPAYKPPKKRYPNHPRPKPAPSPERVRKKKTEVEQYEEDCFNLFGFVAEETPKKSSPKKSSPPPKKTSPPPKKSSPSPKKTPAAKIPVETVESESPPESPSPAKSTPAFSPPKKTARTSATPPDFATTVPKTKSPEQVIMDALTPEEKAYELIERMPMPPEQFTLDVGGRHGVEVFKYPWPDTKNVMNITYIVPGAKQARVIDGKYIHVTFERGQVMVGLVERMSHIFQDKLSNPIVARNFTSFAGIVEYATMNKAHSRTVSIAHVLSLLIALFSLLFFLALQIVGVIQINEFEAQEDFVPTLWDSELGIDGEKVGGGVFPLGPNGEPSLMFTIRDKKKPRSQTMTQKPAGYGNTGYQPSPGGFASPSRSFGQSTYGHAAYGQEFQQSPYRQPPGQMSPFRQPAYGQPQQPQRDPEMAALQRQVGHLTSLLHNLSVHQQQSTAIVPSPRNQNSGGGNVPTVPVVNRGGHMPPVVNANHAQGQPQQLSPMGGSPGSWHTAPGPSNDSDATHQTANGNGVFPNGGGGPNKRGRSS